MLRSVGMSSPLLCEIACWVLLLSVTIYTNHSVTEETLDTWLGYAINGEEKNLEKALITNPLLLNACDKVDLWHELAQRGKGL